MDYQEFIAAVKSNVPLGLIISNPGGGTSQIISYSEKNVSYKRGNSRISVAFEDLYNAYNNFKGSKVSSTDLREYAPRVFDSKQSGHSCNATFLFLVLKLLGKVTEIKGEGKSNHPFYVSIIAE